MSSTGKATPTTADISAIVAAVEQALAIFTGTSVSNLGADAQAVIPLIGALLAAFAPGLAIGGLTATKVLAIVAGLLAGTPDLVNAWNAIKAALDGGAAPTADQWAAFDSAADTAHANLQAAIAAYAKG